jgi:Ni/Co efflux regulator RcnB
VYYAPSYVIGNYHECGLRRPPHGHHWVRVNHDAVLAVVATGVVLDVIYNQFW